MARMVIKIFGRVQGVGFRYAALDEARKLGIKVSPRNEEDGSVRIEAEGDEAALKKFLAWCKHGPAFAKVERVEHE